MKKATSRILIETIVRKALADIKDSPERSTRNLVDMAANFSGGRFQHEFFELAQTMLKNERSPYYELVKDVVAHVDGERILRFGMNLGYNSCTYGAGQIRENEEKYGCHIPWSISLRIQNQGILERAGEYRLVIAQGEALGVYTWMLFAEDSVQEILSLAAEYPDSAFIVFCEPSAITWSVLDGLSANRHLMLAVHYDEGAAQLCGRLRERGLLYSVYRSYRDEDVDSIVSGNLFYSTQQYYPLFTALLSAPECSEDARKRVYDYVVSARREQMFQTIPWEISLDSRFVDSIISEDACSAVFAADGRLLSARCGTGEEYNIFHSDLLTILQGAFPKKKGVLRP